MKTTFYFFLLLFLLLNGCGDQISRKSRPAIPDQLYEFSDQIEPRWFTFENINGEKGAGGKENLGAKGHPCDYIKPGETKTLMNMQGAGIINRIWITISDRSPEMLRSLGLKYSGTMKKNPPYLFLSVIFSAWDLAGLHPLKMPCLPIRKVVHLTALFPCPSKRRPGLYLQMNPIKILDMVFFDIDVQQLKSWDDDFLYFHAYWHRDTATTIAMDYEILPEVKGKGRFLGSNIGVLCKKDYKGFWWGEGEVKMYLDGDKEYPTLAGSGTEDYIGTAWGQGKFTLSYTGCLVAEDESDAWAFYRYHIKDPVYFKSDCRVTIQQIGGGPKADVKERMDRGIKLIPVTIHEIPVLHPIYSKDSITRLDNPALPDGWVNFYRSDDYSSVAYFYLDQPVNDLPEIQGLGMRIYNLQYRMPSGQ